MLCYLNLDYGTQMSCRYNNLSLFCNFNLYFIQTYILILVIVNLIFKLIL